MSLIKKMLEYEINDEVYDFIEKIKRRKERLMNMLGNSRSLGTLFLSFVLETNNQNSVGKILI